AQAPSAAAADGSLDGAAKDNATGKKTKITTKPNAGWSEDEGKRMEEDAARYADEDRKLRELVDARNAGDNMVHSVKKTLSEHGDKLEADEKDKIESAIRDRSEERRVGQERTD